MGWSYFEECIINKIDYDPIDLMTTFYISNQLLIKRLKEPYKLSFMAFDYREKLGEMKDGVRDHCSFTNGVADVDIFKKENNYGILHNPFEGENRVFILRNGEIDKLFTLSRNF